MLTYINIYSKKKQLAGHVARIGDINKYTRIYEKKTPLQSLDRIILMLTFINRMRTGLNWLMIRTSGGML